MDKELLDFLVVIGSASVWAIGAYIQWRKKSKEKMAPPSLPRIKVAAADPTISAPTQKTASPFLPGESDVKPTTPTGPTEKAPGLQPQAKTRHPIVPKDVSEWQRAFVLSEVLRRKY